jgi:stage V sporulation protein B
MAENRAARGTVQLVISQGCLFASGYVITVLLARGLGPEDYGIYGIVLSILFWVEQMSRLGLPSATAKLIAENPQRSSSVAQTAWIIGCFLFLVTFALFWAAASPLAGLFHIPDGVWLLRLAAIDIPFYGMYYIYRGVSEGKRDFATVSIAGMIYGLSKLVGILALEFLGLSIEGALVVNALGSMAALGFLAYQEPIKPMHWHFATVAPMMRLAFPLAIGVMMASLLYHLDLWSLKIMLPEDKPTAMGIYVAASQVARIPQLGVLAISLVVFASLSRALSQNDKALAQRYVQGAVRFLWVILVPVSVLVALEAEEIMRLLYSTRYITGGNLLRILIFGCSLFACLDTFMAILQARGEIYFSVRIGISLVVLMVILNIILIPWYGPLGAASAMTITMGVGTLITGVLVYRRFGLLVLPSSLMKVVLATVCMAVVAGLVSASGPLLVLQYMGLLGLYALTLAFLGELTWKDFQPFALWRRRSV